MKDIEKMDPDEYESYLKMQNLRQIQHKRSLGMTLTPAEKWFEKSYMTSPGAYTPLHTYPKGKSRFEGKIDVNRAYPTFSEWARGSSGIHREDWESEQSFIQRLKAAYKGRYRNLDAEARDAFTYKANPVGSNFFSQRVSQLNDDYLHPDTPTLASQFPRTFTSLDIETNDFGKPVSISALKFIFNEKTRKFENIENYQRFYMSRNADMKFSNPVHGLTHRILNKLRQQQFRTDGITYGKVYDDAEMKSLEKFLGTSVIVGHNIVEYDLQKLFSSPLSNSTIDTLTASRNLWKGRKNGLDDVFKRLYGKTMEEAGLSHHDANSDTIATMMILEKLASSKQGDAIRYVMNHEGVHIAPFDAMINSQLITGKYNRFYPLEKYMTDEEMKRAVANDFAYDKKTGTTKEGVHVIDVGNLDAQTQTDAEVLVSALKETVNNYKGSSSLMTNPEAQTLIEAFNSFAFWKKGSLVEKLASHEDSSWDALLGAYGFNGSSGESDLLKNRARSLQASKREIEEIRKERMLDKSVLHRNITQEQADQLRTANIGKSYDDLADAMDEVIVKNEKLYNVFKGIASIPMYNFERLEQAFKGEVSGIKGAARGLVPNSLYSPFSRITDAAMNGMTALYAPIKYGVRAGTAVGGGLMAAGMGLIGTGVGAPIGIGLTAAGGIAAGASQIFGNMQESKITQWGQGIQNNLNTIGFVTEMVMLPFRLLRSAVNMVIKSFARLSTAIKFISNIMTGGLGNLSQMGNPITGMTGANYGDYIQSTSIDAASLLGKGTVNGLYNDWATQRMKLYTTGQVDTNRLVAASMLGVFDQTYGSRANEEDAFTDAMNKLRETTKAQSDIERKQTYVLANMVNPNMAAILQTMDTLGVDSLDALKHPAGVWGYTDARADLYRSRFQRTQWEYQYAGTQFGVTKGRMASSLWDMGGRSLYNVFNKFMDSLASALETGNWQAIVASAKEGIDSLWITLKEAFGIKNTQSLASDIIDVGIKGLKLFRDKIMPVLETLWVAVSDFIIDKATGLVEFLSTLRVDFGALKDLVLTGKSDKPIITSILDNTWDKNVTRKQVGGNALGDQYYTYEYSPALRGFVDAANKWGAKSRFGAIPITGGTGKIINGGGGVVETNASGSDIYNWISNVLANGTEEELARLGSTLSVGLGRHVGINKNTTADDLLNYIVQSGQNVNAAGFLHPEYFNTDDIERSKFNSVTKTLRDSSIMYGDITGNGLINMAIGSLENMKDPAVLKVFINDEKNKKLVEALVDASGAIKATTHNNYVSVETKDGTSYNFQRNMQMAGSGM